MVSNVLRCLICNSPAHYYFSKTYDNGIYADLMTGIGPIEYFQCNQCGLVMAKTLMELNSDEWNRINYGFHSKHYLLRGKDDINNSPYPGQLLMIYLLAKNNIIDTSDMLDYAAGYRTLAAALTKYFDITINSYEPYAYDISTIDKYIDVNSLTTYKTVICSGVIEHVTERDHLEQINAKVSNDGCLILHTMVKEVIPKDPDWFYLNVPVHAAFYTNKSMAILMKQWGYSHSIYCLSAKSWILFKEKYHMKAIADKVTALNNELSYNYLQFADKFVDFWKS